ncbi:MAG: M6 family metalloprotease domain-containing protein [Candidatus Delongbacteria bacterium]|nr:M6 family metalloprotease domain-containing protein [Candidatus Cloacimonadota bacterium]MCB9474637.1 M6 family metalloprotease domain-containing protein [Candidatus Delongbacteria bacterium]
MIRRAQLALLLSLSLAGTLLAVPAQPGWKTTVQHGDTLRYRLVGDEFCNWAVSESGHTLLCDAAGDWRFASRASNGSLMPGPRLWSARGGAPESALGLEPDPDWMHEHLRSLREQRELRPDGSRPTAREARVDGEWNVLLIMIEYPDAGNSYQPANFEAMMNQPGYGNVGSFRDFYQSMSAGRFGTTATVTQWYTAAHPHNYYGYNQGYEVAQELVVEAVLAADPDVDFSQFDNDGNGTVDGLLVVHSGPGAEEGNQTNIWSHRWSLFGVGPLTLDGVQIWDYTMQPEIQGSDQAEIGVYVHEFGHNLGLPDLYDTDYSSTGVGTWCVMAGGSWGGTFGGPNRPVSFSAWCRTQLGWSTVVSTNGELLDHGLPSVHLSDQVIRLNLPQNPAQYFLIENRQRAAWDLDLANEGLLIWHVDESVNGNSNDFHYKVDLEQADGNQDLNHGYSADAGDPFPGSHDNRRFDLASTPSSLPYGGSDSPVSVVNISDPADTMYADFFQYFSHQDLRVLSVSVDWDESGDNWLDPGEEATLSLQFRNDGAVLNGLNFSLLPDSAPWLEILDGEFSTGPIEENQEFGSGAQALRVRALAGITPGNRSMILHCQDTEGWPQELVVPLAVGRADVLLVNQSDSPEDIAYLTPGLEALGYSWENRIGPDSATAPADMDRYELVIWFCGTTDNPLSGTEQQAMVSRLQAGGNLMLIGQHWHEDLGSGLTGLAGISWGEMVNSTPILVGDPALELIAPAERVLLAGALGAYNQQLPARELLCSDATPILDWQAGGIAGAVRELQSGARLVMLAFSLESVHPSGTVFLSVQTLLDRLIDWQLNGTGVDGTPLDRPAVFGLSLAPNPFNPVTRVQLELARAGDSGLTVYNLQGQQVMRMPLGMLAPGTHACTVDLSGQSSGLYFLSLEVNGRPEAIQRAVLLK